MSIIGLGILLLIVEHGDITSYEIIKQNYMHFKFTINNESLNVPEQCYFIYNF